MSGEWEITHAVGDHVSVGDGNTDLFHYVYSGDDPQFESPRPFFHPLRSRAGDVVSVYRPWDHLWHKGLALSLPHLGPDNFWGGSTYVHPDGYQPLANNGTQRHVGEMEVGADASLAHDLAWTTQDGREVVRERRTIDAELLGDDAWGMVVTSTLTNTSGHTIDIGSPTTAGRPDAGYGGWFWRGPRAFAGAEVFTETGSGHDELMGSTSGWAAISGHHDESDRWSTVVMIDDPSSIRHPVKWFARSSAFACLCPAPFFDEEYAFRPDESVVLRFAFVVGDGQADQAGAAALAERGSRLLAGETR